MAPTMDHQIIRHLLKATAEAANVLGRDRAFAKQLLNTANKIAPNQVGDEGQLKEWLYVEDPFNNHRHVSHLWGLHPGAEITPETPELFEACKKTLELRGDAATGMGVAEQVSRCCAHRRAHRKRYEGNAHGRPPSLPITLVHP